jgi:hypothetical protein
MKGRKGLTATILPKYTKICGASISPLRSCDFGEESRVTNFTDGVGGNLTVHTITSLVFVDGSDTIFQVSLR